MSEAEQYRETIDRGVHLDHEVRTVMLNLNDARKFEERNSAGLEDQREEQREDRDVNATALYIGMKNLLYQI